MKKLEKGWDIVAKEKGWKKLSCGDKYVDPESKAVYYNTGMGFVQSRGEIATIILESCDNSPVKITKPVEKIIGTNTWTDYTLQLFKIKIKIYINEVGKLSDAYIDFNYENNLKFPYIKFTKIVNIQTQTKVEYDLDSICNLSEYEEQEYLN